MGGINKMTPKDNNTGSTSHGRFKICANPAMKPEQTFLVIRNHQLKNDYLFIHSLFLKNILEFVMDSLCFKVLCIFRLGLYACKNKWHFFIHKVL